MLHRNTNGKVTVAVAVLALFGGIVLTGCSTVGGSSKETDEGMMQGMKAHSDQMSASSQQITQTTESGGMNMSATNMMSGKMMQDMKPEMMERMQVLMRTPTFLDGPLSIYAQSEKLGLSEEQKKQLMEIERQARDKAQAVLTPEQQTKLGSVPNKPVTMMETCPMMKTMQSTQ